MVPRMCVSRCAPAETQRFLFWESDNFWLMRWCGTDTPNGGILRYCTRGAVHCCWSVQPPSLLDQMGLIYDPLAIARSNGFGNRET